MAKVTHQDDQTDVRFDLVSSWAMPVDTRDGVTPAGVSISNLNSRKRQEAGNEGQVVDDLKRCGIELEAVWKVKIGRVIRLCSERTYLGSHSVIAGRVEQLKTLCEGVQNSSGISGYMHLSKVND